MATGHAPNNEAQDCGGDAMENAAKFRPSAIQITIYSGIALIVLANVLEFTTHCELRVCFALAAFATLTARSFLLDTPSRKNKVRGVVIALFAAAVIYVALGAVALVWK
jgi:hypothetical protein